ncbi:hypothetical protein BT96DRAFT_403899 [Gymnopus androsaceus JB14]|uniref:Uncharacterized protein n=1 Tax=Gymnopus androsaceus JB14 TaxID=1447944 RepID=A0A6A4I7N7_9AGAR|nr:hypothetical protein BT96DRAFT_403899 [Gymnopus androsaceus JB14]
MDFFPMHHSRLIPTNSFHRNIGFCTIEVLGGDSKLSCHQLVPLQSFFFGCLIRVLHSPIFSKFMDNVELLVNQKILNCESNTVYSKSARASKQADY